MDSNSIKTAIRIMRAVGVGIKSVAFGIIVIEYVVLMPYYVYDQPTSIWRRPDHVILIICGNYSVYQYP